MVFRGRAVIVDTVIKTYGVSTQQIVKHTTVALALETVILSGYSSIVSGLGHVVTMRV